VKKNVANIQFKEKKQLKNHVVLLKLENVKQLHQEYVIINVKLILLDYVHKENVVKYVMEKLLENVSYLVQKHVNQKLQKFVD